MSGWKIVGINDDATECEICGRIELKSTVHLVTDEGDEIRAGSTCAARKVGTTATKMRSAIKAYRMHFEVARCHFPQWFRDSFGTRLDDHIRTYGRTTAENAYRRYMRKAGFTV